MIKTTPTNEPTPSQSTEQASCVGQMAFSVPIQLTERAGIIRSQEPVTVGVPIPKGLCFSAGNLEVYDQHGRAQGLQTKILARWSDESLKWVLLDFQANVGAHEIVTFTLSQSSGTAGSGGAGGISVSRCNRDLVVDTGVAEFSISAACLMPFDRVIVRGVEAAGIRRSRLVVTDGEGSEYLPYLDGLEIETAGPLRTTIRAEGMLRSQGGTVLAEFIARLTFYAQSSTVKFDWTIRNSRAAIHPRGLWDLGDPQSIYFRDCSLYLGLFSEQVESVDWSAAPQGPVQSQRCELFELYQDSSGGENWQSPNHVNRLGRVMTTFRGYRLKLDGVLVDQGNRATPTIRVRSGGTSVSAAVQGFWENFPKALEVQDGRLCLRLFPRQYSDLFELQAGEQKTHSVFLQWDATADPQPLEWIHNRLAATVTPDWYAATNALPHVAPLSKDRSVSDCEMAAEHLVNMAVTGTNTFFDRRETVDEYGWRNFGDLYADHEAVNWKGEPPLVAHYNNQYDVIYGSIVQLARSGNYRWHDLVCELAKHVIDIDLYRTKHDRPALNGGLFWHTDHYTDAGTSTHRSFSITSPQAKASPSYGGGPACEHNYAAGLLHYYYLTGDPAGQEAVALLADWVINMDDGSKRSLGWLDRRPTGYCSVTATQGYHGPGRGSGNSISVLLDGWLMSGSRSYLSKAEELIMRCIHPHDDIDRRNLADIEYRWSYTVFLQVIGKYLDLKGERGELDQMYAYAKASLLHYANWMAQHEVPYKAVLDRVLIPSETWPAQDIRKANVFCIAAKYASSEKREEFRAKADYFFQACIADMQTFSTHALTRPLVLLLTNAYVYSYYRQHPSASAPSPVRSYNFGRPRSFKSQFHEIYLLRDYVHEGLRMLRFAKQILTGLVKPAKPEGGSGHA